MDEIESLQREVAKLKAKVRKLAFKMYSISMIPNEIKILII